MSTSTLRAVDAQHDDFDDDALGRAADLECERETEEIYSRMLDGIRYPMGIFNARSVERDALKLALTLIEARGDYPARRSLELIQRIARKLSEPLGEYMQLRFISDRD